MAGFQAPQGVFRVDLVSEFSLHQGFLLSSVSHAHFYAAGLHDDADLRTADERRRSDTELAVMKAGARTVV